MEELLQDWVNHQVQNPPKKKKTDPVDGGQNFDSTVP